MGDETKRIKLLVESKTRNNGQISALFVAGVFQRLQNILYYIIDELEGNPTRKAGDFPNSVKEKAELVISGMHIGSVEAELMISDSQMCLPGSVTYGEKALLIADEILVNVSQEKDIAQALSETVKNEHRLNRVLHELDAIWPDEQSEYNVGLGFGKQKIMRLQPSHKHVFRNMLSRQPENVEKSVIGRLMEVRVDQRRSFQIDTFEGVVTCTYAQDLEDRIIENIGRLVLIRGVMALEKGGKYALRLVNEKSIEDLELLPLDKIKMKGRSLNLKEPILLEVVYQDDQYWVSNDKFHLRGYGSTLKAAIEDLNEEIEILWEDYVETGLEQLSRDAMDFRKELIASFGGEKSNANV
jgi:hypothetical protein